MSTLMEAAQNMANFLERMPQTDEKCDDITRSELKSEEEELGGLLADLDKALVANTNVAAILVARELIGRSANAIIESMDNEEATTWKI